MLSDLYPEDWKIQPLRDLVRHFLNGGTPRTENPNYWDGHIPWITGADAEERITSTSRKNITALGVRDSATNVVPKDNILLVTRTGVGKVSIAGVDVAISQDLTGLVVNLEVVKPQYLYRQLFHNGRELQRLAQGSIIQGIERREIEELKLPVPSLPEQQKIAQILATIDNLITLTDRHIAKLKLAKAGLLHDLLTRGIDENGELRDPIAHPEQFKETAIGRIPKKWSVVPLEEKASIRSGTTPLRENSKYWQEGTIPWIKTGEINYEVIYNSEEKVTPKALNETSLELYPAGTILMAMYGQGITRGKVGILGIEATTNQACAAIIVNEKDLLSSYLFNYLTYKYEQIRNIGHGSNQSNLNEKIISKFILPLPSIEEQQRIANLLNSHNIFVRKKNDSCEKLKLLKKGLMADLLTGRVRVNLDVIEEG